MLYSSDKKEGGCSAGVGLASPESSATMEVVTPSDLLLQTPSQCILQEDGSCSCPVRQQPPDPPVYDPSLSTEQLKELIISHYLSSSFNRCTRQALPSMKGEPMPIITDKDAKPVAFHTPVKVPLHWSDQVKKDLDRDVSLGVIEPVPIFRCQSLGANL